jgi:hypothetical protein
MSGQDLRNSINTPTYTAGIVKTDFNAIEFNGVDQYINYDDKASRFAGIQGAFSVAIWIRPTAGSNSIIRYWISLGTSAAAGTGFQLLIPTSSFVARYISGSGFSSGTALTADAWNHVVFTNEGTSRKFYINNGAPSTNTNASNTFSATELKIGSNVTGAASFFLGAIDDIRLYKRVLTADEVALLYNYKTV